MRPRLNLRMIPRLLVIALVAALSACAGNNQTSREEVEAEEMQGALAGLCRAASEASRDVERARRTFQDESHDLLHALAAELESEHRDVAAALLTAKNTVERAFRQDDPAVPSVTDGLAALIVATADGMRALGLEAPDCSAANVSPTPSPTPERPTGGGYGY